MVREYVREFAEKKDVCLPLVSQLDMLPILCNGLVPYFQYFDLAVTELAQYSPYCGLAVTLTLTVTHLRICTPSVDNAAEIG